MAMRSHRGATRWLAIGAVAVALMVTACATSNPTASSGAPVSSGAPASGTPASPRSSAASDVAGPFQLTFELPRTMFKAGEPIQGQATLAVVGGTPIAFGSSGSGPFAFDVTEVGGSRHIKGVMTADCAPYRLDPGQPMTSVIKKSGGYSGDDPNAAFAQTFLQGPDVILPAGDWTITAVASLVEGAGCTGVGRNLRAPITIHVTPS